MLKDKHEVFKLLKDIQSCKKLYEEAKIQNYLHFLFKSHIPQVKIPKITYVNSKPIVYNKTTYLCGIGMEYLNPPAGFEEQLHILLGYNNDDIDSEWGMTVSLPVSETNPTRGFFASPETMELVWKEEGSDATIEGVAYLMGLALRLMIDSGVLPIDLEWVWSNNSLWIIDFGLCEFGYVDPFVFLNKKGTRGLADDFYIPREGYRGYEEFMRGYSTTL